MESWAWDLRLTQTAQSRGAGHRYTSRRTVGDGVQTGIELARLVEGAWVSYPSYSTLRVVVQADLRVADFQSVAAEAGGSAADAANADRLATLQRGTPICLPSTDDLVFNSTAAGQETFAFAEGQFVPTAEVDDIADIEVRQSVVVVNAESGERGRPVTAIAAAIEQVAGIRQHL